jgi:nicotinamidase/pyrazinamidase
MHGIIVVDMQQDFVSPGGKLFVPEVERKDLPRAIERHLDVQLDVVVVATKCWHPKSDPSFKENGGEWPVHCLRNYPGSELAVTLFKLDMVLHKTGYSAFGDDNDPTGLHEFLRARWVNHLTIMGVAYDFCVGRTALSAAKLGYEVTIRRDLVAGVAPASCAEMDKLLTKEGVHLV